MNRYLKLALVAITLMAGVAIVSSAQASINTTIDGWSQGAITEGDKLYTWLPGTTLPDDIGISFATNIRAGFLLHPVSNRDLSELTAGTYVLRYSVEIVNPDTSFRFGTVKLDSTISYHDVTVTKKIYGDESFTNPLVTLTSTNGSSPGVTTIPGALRKVWVNETFDLDSNGLLQSASNTYTEVTPEPATIIVWSLLGGLSLVFAWRKRKTA